MENMKIKTIRKNLNFYCILIIHLFYGCSINEPKLVELLETESIEISYELGEEEKSLSHPIILPGAPGEEF